VAAGLALGVARAAEKPATARDPELAIPSCRQPPRINGKLEPGEWQYAAAVSLLEDVGEFPNTVRQEQPRFYVFRDADNLYVAMESLDSNNNGIVAKSTLHDHMSIIGDDGVELMVAPGAGEDLSRFDFPTFYLALNAIGAIWDAKFVPNSAECHNSWESGAEMAHGVDGTYWACELRIPLVNIRKELPRAGEVWRMNFDRTYFGYHWSAWQAGGLNDARCGGDVRFAPEAPAVRLVGVDDLADGKFRLRVEIANGTQKAQTVTVSLRAEGQDTAGGQAQPVGAATNTVAVAPGQTVEVKLGDGRDLRRRNTVVIEASDAAGQRLLYMDRRVNVPAPRYVKCRAPAVQLVYVNPRYLPSLDRLAVLVDGRAWVKKTGYVGEPPRAEIKVFKKGARGGAPVMAGEFRDFKDATGTWRGSTKDLPEGEYEVEVRVFAGAGEPLAVHEDWFEKRVFDWMKNPRGVGGAVPPLYRPLEAKGRDVTLWGRTYRFDESGLLRSVVSQGREWLAAPMTWAAEAGGKPAEVKVVEGFKVTEAKPAVVKGRSVVQVATVKLALEAALEYDGFLLYRATYAGEGPAGGELGRLRLRAPLAGRGVRYYSASGDPQGVSILGDVLPAGQGRIFDSYNNTRSVCCSPSFATLLWLADETTCFCYAADNDKGWVLRDDAPALELHREGETLVLWLNVIDRPAKVTEARTLEFAFQAGPLKALPEGWRGLQFGGNPKDAPLTVNLSHQAGSGYTLAGGTHFIHPGATAEQQQQSRVKIEKDLAAGSKAVVGYHYWGTVPKGFPETRVFRGEWGIDKDTWERATEVRKWEWDNRFYGEDQDRYIILYVKPVPSYVDFTAYAQDEALKHTALTGFYDDTGYPKPVFDEELGLGFTREDGRRVWSSGLWVYRERWKRAAYVNFQNQRPNYLMDSQHVHAHYMPAYGFIGLWAPCEMGFYNSFKDRDNLGFYRSVDRYAACNPSRQFGQVPMIGMSSPQGADAALFARDTRCMMMLALLNDQDVGSFGARDPRVVARLRRARNRFKTWEPEVVFVGYWQSGGWVTADPPDVKVSLYRRPDSVLLVLGNVGDVAAEAVVEPDWAKLKVDPAGLAAVDAETNRRLELNAGASGKGLKVEVARHDVRLVVLGPAGRSADPDAGRALGAALPGPKQVIPDLCDPLAGPELGKAWVKDGHTGASGAAIVDGRLCVWGNHYGFSHVRRELRQDNVSVQCLILRPGTGGGDEWGGSLFLHWPNGEYAQATPGTGDGKFLYVLSGGGRRTGPEVNRESVAGWYPYGANWVKIALTPAQIIFSSSSDGKTWSKDWEAARGPKHSGAPEFVMLGNGSPGPAPLLKNPHPQHFSPASFSSWFFSDLVVGEDR
jgi:hypothetical protein